MGKNFTAMFAVALAVSALPLACGDDEKDSGGKGGGTSTGGTGGKGTGGGKATGGTGTGGGKATGGTGTGGKATGGTGTGGGKATGGTTPGGAGGEGGAMGGEGGGGTMATQCERFCDAGDVANCTNPTDGCITQCDADIAYGIANGDPGCDVLLNAYYECSIAGTPGDWACNGRQPSYAGTECLDESMAANLAFCFP